MPTASPSISARVGEVLETVTTLETTTTALRVTPTPTRAVRIGMPAVTRDPKVTHRMRNDTISPRSSGTLLGSAVLL